MTALAEIAARSSRRWPSTWPRIPEPASSRRSSAAATGRSCIEAIREGYLLHYGEPRVFSGMDEDLRLLAGDSLFALGLERLTATGDLEAVAELSDLISLCAKAEAEGRRDRVPALVERQRRAARARVPGRRRALLIRRRR